MSLGPDKIGPLFDLLNGTGGTQASTGVCATVSLPPGRKAIQVNMGTGIVAALKIQNSVDGTNWFDVTTNTVANSGNLYEVDSCVPRWRANYTLLTTAATTASPNYAWITQQVL
jgi:hypothetical protein